MSKMPLIASIYNPQNQTKERLVDSFVVRLKTFSKLFKEIEEAKMEVPEQHHLIIGKRGLGKTTLLLRLAYEVEQTSTLNNWLIPVVFNEEEYGIRKLYKFWIRIAELLEEKEDLFYGLPQEMDDLSDQYSDDAAYEKAIFEILTRCLKEHDKKIILFIDNVGDMFTKFSDLEAHRLRKILQTSIDIRIFAASSKYIESFFQYKHPFYEFFKITQLEGLNQKETESLLIKLGELYGYKDTIKGIIKNQKGRIEALRRLTGGVIRTIVLLFEIFIDEQKGTAFMDLEAILDRVTPLYKHRMDDLPKQQQEIVEAIALSWSAVNVKEIRQKTRMESKMISAQLTHLVKNGVINRIPTSTKNHLYQINERFFNIWYLMRCGRKGDKKEVIWLVKFFELWCRDEKDIIDRVQKHINHLKSGKYDTKAAYYVTEALAAVGHLPLKKQDELLQTTQEFLKGKNSSLFKSLSSSDYELLDKIGEAYEVEDKSRLIRYHLQLKTESRFYLLGLLYEGFLEDEKTGEEYYLKAIKTREKGNALLKLGRIYEARKDFKKAEKTYLASLKAGNENASRELGFLYSISEFENIQNAKKYFEIASDYNLDGANEMLGFINTELENYNLAEKYFVEALNLGNKHILPYLASFYRFELNNFEKAEKYYREAIKNNIGKGASGLANLYLEKEGYKDEEIEKLFLKAIKLGEETVHISLGNFYLKKKKIDEALFHFNKGKENNYLYVNLVLGFIHLEKFNNYLKAENYFFKAIGKIIEDKKEIKDSYIEVLTKTFIFFLQRKKYKELLAFFNDKKSNLKTEFQPIYYALMYYLQDEYPNEYLRMGSELKETVEEIIAEVEEMKTTYQK